MPRREYSSPYLSDCERDPVRIACERCGRAWSEPKADLLARFGDGPMPSLIQKVTNCGQRGSFSAPCGAGFADLDYAAQRQRYIEAMQRYRWISQLAAADARVFVRCTNPECGRQTTVVRERLLRWLARHGRGRDLSVREVQRKLRCGHGDPDGSGFGCGQKRAVLEWIASETVPPPDPTLRRPGEKR